MPLKINSNEIENRLLAVLKEADRLLPKSELDQMVELVEAGELGIGLENFCTQVFEYEVEVPASILTEIAVLGTAMGIASDYWQRLKGGPTP